MDPKIRSDAYNSTQTNRLFRWTGWAGQSRLDRARRERRLELGCFQAQPVLSSRTGRKLLGAGGLGTHTLGSRVGVARFSSTALSCVRWLAQLV